jgi:hypothetical protein
LARTFFTNEALVGATHVFALLSTAPNALTILFISAPRCYFEAITFWRQRPPESLKPDQLPYELAASSQLRAERQLGQAGLSPDEDNASGAAGSTA